MSTFPLHSRPKESYKEPPRSFGSPRANRTRQHAGCDLYAPAGSEVLAVEDGTVQCGPYPFYDVVSAIEIQHPSGVVRYGEISAAAAGLRPGTQVQEGQVIGYVGKMLTVAQSMLHFEMFSGAAAGPLTDLTSAPFMRRSDLLDPTAFLDACRTLDGAPIWKHSPQCTSFVKSAEGCRLKAYWDRNGWAIGYGHRAGVTEHQQIDQAIAEALLNQDLSAVDDALARVFPGVLFTQDAWDALCSLGFNLQGGPAAFPRVAPKMTAAVRRADWQTAAREMLDIDHDANGVELAGLKARRRQEAAMMLGQGGGA
jgi:GH24 family phage-related lysozyme (muramidase)